MKYRYTATTRQGKMENGAVEAQNATEAAERIRAEGLLVVSLKKENAFEDALMSIGWVPNVVKVTFSKHMALMIRAGLPLDEAVRVLRDQAQGRFRRVLTSVLKDIETGRPLSDAFAEHPSVFTELFIATVRAGESSGTLEESLNDLADQLTKSYELQRKIRGAMLYPILVLVSASGIGMGLSLYVLPRVVKLFESITADLPLMTRVLIGFSSFMVRYGAIFIPGVIVAIVLFLQFMRWKPIRPFSHAVFLKLPIFGKLAKEYNLALFSRTMGMLLRSGIAIGEAFQIASNTIYNARYKRALVRVREGTESGVPASAVLEEFPHLFPSVATRMIAVGERTGKLEETYDYLAQFYEDEVDVVTKNLSTILEPVLLIIIGLAVAFVAISVITPIYNFIGNIGRL